MAIDLSLGTENCVDRTCDNCEYCASITKRPVGTQMDITVQRCMVDPKAMNGKGWSVEIARRADGICGGRKWKQKETAPSGLFSKTGMIALTNSPVVAQGGAGGSAGCGGGISGGAGGSAGTGPWQTAHPSTPPPYPYSVPASNTEYYANPGRYVTPVVAQQNWCEPVLLANPAINSVPSLLHFASASGDVLFTSSLRSLKEAIICSAAHKSYAKSLGTPSATAKVFHRWSPSRSDWMEVVIFEGSGIFPQLAVPAHFSSRFVVWSGPASFGSVRSVFDTLYWSTSF